MAIFYVLFLLIFGTLNTLTTKWQFSMESMGLDGNFKNFQKPWWGNFAMFAAMIVVLAVYFFEEYKKIYGSDQPDVEYDEEIEDEDVGTNKESLLPSSGIMKSKKKKGIFASFFTKQRLQEFVAVSVPAILDLVSSGLNFMGLLCISASVWQMLRGSMIVFSALLSILFLDRKMAPFHWLGIFLCVCGIACVGSASVLGDAAAAAQEKADEAAARIAQGLPELTAAEKQAAADADAAAASKAGFGLLLVMTAQVVQAAQCVSEERLLKNLSIPGTLVVAFEGMWGCIIMLGLVFPLLDVIPGDDVGGVQENTLDTVTMIENSSTLQVMLVIYLISCSTYNIPPVIYLISCSTYNVARMLVTSTMSAIHFTMIDCSRTALVWLIDLGLMYKAPESYHQFGEKWTQYSPLQAAGFMILIFGQCVYGGLFIVPVFTKFLYPDLSDDVISSLKYSQVASCRHLATPLPPFSPPSSSASSSQCEDSSSGNNGSKKQKSTLYLSLGKDNAILAEGRLGVEAGA